MIISIHYHPLNNDVVEKIKKVLIEGRFGTTRERKEAFMLAEENANGGVGTVIIYKGTLGDNARKRLAACRKNDQPVFAINMDLFMRKREIIRRDFVFWSINHLIAELTFCTQKGKLFKRPYGVFYWIKAAARDCKRNLKMAHEFPNAL